MKKVGLKSKKFRITVDFLLGRHYIHSMKMKGNTDMMTFEQTTRNFDQIKQNAELFSEMSRTYTSWKNTYFYAEDLDWVPMICLIDERFIKKIERFQTEEELCQERDNH